MRRQRTKRDYRRASAWHAVTGLVWAGWAVSVHARPALAAGFFGAALANVVVCGIKLRQAATAPA